jgi:transcription elongation factor Elf1
MTCPHCGGKNVKRVHPHHYVYLCRCNNCGKEFAITGQEVKGDAQ